MLGNLRIYDDVVWHNSRKHVL